MKKTITLLLSVLFFVQPVMAAESFGNMKSLIATLEIMNGYPDGNFYGDLPVTRAQFAKITISASPLRNTVSYSAKTSPFKDVLYSHWAAPYIKAAVSNKLVTGYPDSTFLPENPVTLAEAVTVAVKLLGYTDADFTSAWPYGQMGVARNIGVLDNISGDIGTQLSRAQVMTLMYNTVMTKSKGGDRLYLESLGYTLSEDTIIRATSTESMYVGADKVLTTNGTYKITDNFSSDWIGRRGDAIISSENELILFFPENQTKETYNVYSVTGGNVVLYKGSNITNVTLNQNMAVYYGTNNQSETLSSVISKLTLGDVITVCKNENGIVDYAMIFSGESQTSGPVTAKGSAWKTQLEIRENATVIRDGKSAELGAVQANDILYYSATLNILWVYSKKVTGVYEKANPSKDAVSSAVISGTEYEIESVAAMKALSAGGSFELGDTVTILLGKDGKIADVITPDNNTIITGYLKSVGVKEYEDISGNTLSTNYATIVMADGSETEFNVSTDYKHLRSSVVRVVFGDDKTTLRKENLKSDLSGKISYEDKKIGNKPAASNIEILDVSTTDNSETGTCASVFLQRIDGLEIRSSSVLYYTQNSNGEIDTLILKDITGDMHDYGIVKSVPEKGGSYKCMVGTAEKTLSAGNSTFAVSSGQPVQIKMNGNSLKTLSSLLALNKKVSEITNTYITAEENTYLLADKVAVYNTTFGAGYKTVSLSDLIANQADYNIEAFYDRSEKNGGRIRVLKITNK